MRVARSSSTLRRLATIRARMPGCSHLDSSNTNALTMCSCSTGVWLTQNCRAWLKWSAKRVRADPLLGPGLGRREGREPTGGVLAWPAVGPRVGLVVDATDRVGHRHVAVLLEVGDRALRGVDREVREVRAAEALQLGVEVREVAALQQRVVGEVDAGDDVLGAERDLLGLGEEVVDRAVEHEPADAAHRHQLLGDDLGGVEHVEVELVGEVVVEELHAELPLREVAAVDGVPQVAAVEVGVGAVDLDGLVPHHRLHAELRLPVELDERRLAGRRSTNRNVWTPKPSMNRNERGMARSDIVHITMWVASGISEMKSQKLSCADWACGKPTVRLLLHGVDEVGELDRVLDEEDRDVVADEVPVALLRVELHGEAADVAGEVGRALVAGDRREAHEHRGALAGSLEQVGAGDVGQRLVGLEEAVGAEAAGVDHALGDALVVEVEDLLAEVEVLEQRRAPRHRRAACSGRRRPGTPCWVVRRARPAPACWWVSPPSPVVSIRSSTVTSSPGEVGAAAGAVLRRPPSWPAPSWRPSSWRPTSS